MRTPDERDSQDRYPGAPAWNGDLARVSPAGLEEHDRAVQSYIANVTVKYESWNDRQPWRTTTAAERRAAGLDRYVARLVEVRTERIRREQQAGGFSDYLNILCDHQARTAPWPTAGRKAARS